MITKFKIYESLNEYSPKIGDHVLIESRSDYFKKYENKIGKIVDVDISKDKVDHKKMLYYVNFYISETHNYIGNRREPIYGFEIKYWSDDIKELNKIIDLKKYNL